MNPTSTHRENSPPLNSFTTALKIYGLDEFACGCVGGVAKVLAGHPFDTIKGRVQAGTYGATATPLEALRATIKNEGALALYKGLVPPCIAVGFVSGTLFFVNGRVRSFIQPDKSIPLTYQQMLIAAGCGGCAVGCVVTPFEVLKLNRQISATTTSDQKNKTGTVRGIVEHSGFGVRGLYCGFGATLIREAGTFGFFFPINEFFRHETGKWYFGSKDQNTNQQQLPVYLRVICAGTSGMLCWFPFYPIDQVKTRIQTQSFVEVNNINNSSTEKKTMMSMREAFHQLYFNEGGVRRLYRGLTPCLIRAFPAYAAQYTTYETVLKYVHK